jgi:hypothetical protein
VAVWVGTAAAVPGRAGVGVEVRVTGGVGGGSMVLGMLVALSASATAVLATSPDEPQATRRKTLRTAAMI